MAISPKNSASGAQGSSFGEVLESLSNAEPQSISIPAYLTAMQTCGNGVGAGLYDGKVLVVCVSPVPTCYHLESAGFNKTVVCLAVSKSKEFCLSGASKAMLRSGVL